MKLGSFMRRTTMLCAVLVLFAGCASSPRSRYYVLTPVTKLEAKQPAEKPRLDVSVSVMPVEIPDFLDRPHIVTGDGRNGVKLAEFDRWAGSLSESMSMVLAENLSQILGTDNVFVDSWHPEKADYSVAMRVLRLDCLPSDRVFLKAQWIVLSSSEHQDDAMHVATFTQKLSDNQYETIAAAVSQTIEQLSREIAAEIKSHVEMEEESDSST